jgi:glycosyltransferase involved in cell wall biosynthesis
VAKLSIITINFNNKLGLRRTFDSIFAQTFIEFEYIVIDGGSCDGSKELIETHQNKINYWVSEKDNGIYHAMNKGIRAASGDYLLFMNSGDVLISDSNILNDCCLKLNEDIVAFDCFLEKDNKIIGRRTHIEKPTLYYVYKYGFKHQSTFIKRGLFYKLGLYNEAFIIAGDYEFWIRCFLESTTTCKCYKIPIAIFELSGISQGGGWAEEHKRIEYELLSNIISDLKDLERYYNLKNSRFFKFFRIKMIINMVSKVKSKYEGRK